MDQHRNKVITDYSDLREEKERQNISAFLNQSSHRRMHKVSVNTERL